MTRYCPHCYVGINPEDTVCRNCGESLIPEVNQSETVQPEVDQEVSLEPLPDAVDASAVDQEVSLEPLPGAVDTPEADQGISLESLSDAVNPSETVHETETAEVIKEIPTEETTYRASNPFEKDTPPETVVAPQPAMPVSQPPKKTETNQDHIISLGEWMWSLLLTFIPIVNIIALIVWSVSETTNPNKKNFARARLIYAGIGIVVWIVLLIVFFVSAAAIGSAGYYYY